LTVSALREHGLGARAAHGVMHLPVGFGLNPLKYTLGLAAAAVARGVRLYGGSEVTRIERDGAGARLHTARGTLRAGQLLIATNGYSTDGLPPWLTGRYLPVLSNIVATRPLTNVEQAAQGWTSTDIVADSRNLLHYFRLLPDGRFLFGMRGGTGLGAAEVDRVAARIRADFVAMFPAWAGIEIPFSWNGLACLTSDRVAHLGPVPELPGTFAAFGYHGGGVAMASWCGARVADLMAGRIRPADVPAPLAHRPRPMPMPALRRHYLKPAYAWYGWRDGG
jgi:glycine/D-amino acid oxidase-like deaminating enzyme